jgi:hypothetical protein
MQVTAMVAVCPAVTVTEVGCEHGSSCHFPDPLPVSMSGERPDTWYRPGGNQAEKAPEDSAWALTWRWPAAVKVTVPAMGRSPGC